MYKVYNSIKKRVEAISIMDIKVLKKLGCETLLFQEMEVGFVLSELVTNEICPHFIETYQVFQFKYKPNKDIWSDKKLILENKTKIVFMKIRIE